jgi:hypothetical protein
MGFNDEKTCSKCVYSIFDMDHILTVPSIHICYNRKSGHYEESRAWSDVCEEFLSEEQRNELINAEWKKNSSWIRDTDVLDINYEVDVFTEKWANTKFPENSYDCNTIEEVSEIISNCSRKISGIVKVEVWINHGYEK